MNKDSQVDIRAVLTRKQHKLLTNSKATLEVPYGVKMYNKLGSVVLNFECEDREIADALCDALDVSGISWDESL